MQLRPCPHEDLHQIYALEGLAYQKNGRQIQRTILVLDYANIYFDLSAKFFDLQALVAFLT